MSISSDEDANSLGEQSFINQENGITINSVFFIDVMCLYRFSIFKLKSTLRIYI